VLLGDGVIQSLHEHSGQSARFDSFDDLLAHVARDTSPMPAPERIALIRNGLCILAQPEQVVELRALGINGKRRTDSGYFKDMEKLACAAAAYENRAEGVYVTLNPVNPALIARANNRVKEYASHTSTDNDILRRIWLPIDFDAVRPADISSTREEHHAALKRAWDCFEWLREQGWGDPVFASSGNGAHLLYRIDLPNDAAATELVKGVLTSLSERFSDDTVKVDTATSNASRIFKLYGTLARKGDSTPERPHRRALILSAPEVPIAISVEQLSALIAPVTATPRRELHTTGENAYGRAALEKEIAKLCGTTINRNIQLFQSSAALFSLVAGGALDGNTVWSDLLDAARGVGLPESEARKTIASGEKHGLSNPRTAPESTMRRKSDERVPLKILPAVQTETPQEQPASPLMHIDELDKLPPIQWLIKDVLPANMLVEVHGPPACGKTQVVFDMAQTLAATGKSVIYVVAEGLQGHRARKKAWQTFRKQEAGKLFVWSKAVHLLQANAVRDFINSVQSHEPALIVFDTLSRCCLGADENSQKDMNFILESLDIIRRETGATVVAVHHTNASGLRECGSTVIRGGMDVMLDVSRDDDLIVVTCAKMKDAPEFSPMFFKGVSIDIGEDKPVPVLVPAERVIQTPADSLTPVQLEILRAVGMEMFSESGIKSSQLDELLPEGTKRSTKYHSLNTLIRLGYVQPHTKGDPYCMTDAGRLKLSNALESSVTAKSNVSKRGPSVFIWTLPDGCPMSSPIPHSSECGMDWTSDSSSGAARVDEAIQQTCTTANYEADKVYNTSESLMPAEELAMYARRAGVRYPTASGEELYRIARLVPLARRDAFEYAIGDAISLYYEEIAKHGEPPQPEPDVIEHYLSPGLVSGSALYKAYMTACNDGRGTAFRETLAQRAEKASNLLAMWLEGRKQEQIVHIPKIF
jgi:hypothetical protein